MTEIVDQSMALLISDGAVRELEKFSLVTVKTMLKHIFTLKETVYAYDKGKSGDTLYEAHVIKLKEDASGLKYFVKYRGYKKSHNKWLSSNEMMKQTVRNKFKFLKSRTLLPASKPQSAEIKKITLWRTMQKWLLVSAKQEEDKEDIVGLCSSSASDGVER